MSQDKKRVTIKDPLIRSKLNLKPNADFRYRLKGKKLKRYFEILESIESEKVENNTSDNDYESDPFVLSAWNKDTGKLMTIDEFCECYNMPRNLVASWKFLPHHYKEPTFHIVFKPSIEEKTEKEIDFSKLLKGIKPVKVEKKSPKIALFDRVVYTDAHIAMEPNKNGYSLYGGVWDEEEVNDRLEIFVNKIIAEQESNVLYLDDLGDFMDGYDGFTTRGGHSLPQNMDNERAFDVGLSFKVKKADALMKHYDRIVFRNICEDNHGGSFGYMVNKAFKELMKVKYPKNVEVINQRKFIDHYKVDKFVFITTHGKDSKDLKFGFKPVLDAKQIEKISDYIDEHYLNTPGAIIEFSKGDSHQYLFDNSSSDKFNYYNYPAFSPSSGWVQTNFKKGISGFVCFNYYKDKSKSINDHIFEWKRNKVA
jgi:hypothetical protein